MARARTIYRCNECGAAEPKWTGRCSACEAWNSLVEEVVARRRRPRPRPSARSAAVPLPIAEVDTAAWAPAATHVGELDRVLQGGLVPGSVTVLGGEPGIGKSTLLLQALAGLAKSGLRCLYVTAEESAQQVRLRAERLGALPPNLWLVSDTALPHVLAHIESVAPDVVAIDSIQTVFEPSLSSAPGSVAQVRECAHRLVRTSKDRAMSSVLVGHVTKDGALAGPRVLEHLVDTVLSFEGERHHALRLLRAVKHRFGSTDELGPVRDDRRRARERPRPVGAVPRRPASGHARLRRGAGARRPPPAAGRGAGARREVVHPHPAPLGAGARQRPARPRGRRPPAARVDAVPRARRPHGRRRRREDGRARAPTWRWRWPWRRRATASPVPDDLVACGEVGLGGELRQVHQTARRLAEAARLGFRRAVVPASAPLHLPDLEVVRVATLKEAVEACTDELRQRRAS